MKPVRARAVRTRPHAFPGDTIRNSACRSATGGAIGLAWGVAYGVYGVPNRGQSWRATATPHGRAAPTVPVPLQLQIAEDGGLVLPFVPRAEIDPELAFGLLGGPDQDQFRLLLDAQLPLHFARALGKLQLVRQVGMVPMPREHVHALARRPGLRPDALTARLRHVLLAIQRVLHLLG